MLRRTRGAFVAAPIPILILACARTAAATPPMIIDGDAVLQGEHRFSELIVRSGGRLRAPPMAALSISAHRILVENDAFIDATGAGYQGADLADGGQPAGTQGGGQVPDLVGFPGGGGAYGGAGGRGTDAACTALTTADGGQPYFATIGLDFGSAGGAARQPKLGFPSRGGHGGGWISLTASEIVVHGQILARGEDGVVAEGLGSGGGAGGAIRIRAVTLSGSGRISAAGGRGGKGSRSGGGGGGGVLLVTTASGRATPLLDVAGGGSGDCAAPAGGAGELMITEDPACLDVDADGEDTVSCGGTDCDDGDPAIHTGGVDDTCDGQDNDCSGTPDDALPAHACPDQHVCQDGRCVALPDAGPPDAGPEGARPDHLELRSGGCALARGRARGGAGIALLGVALAGALARRRARVVGRVVSRRKLP